MIIKDFFIIIEFNSLNKYEIICFIYKLTNI